MDDESKKILIELLKNSRTASLGTSNKNQPFVSMVAFSSSNNFNEFYIHVSQLAIHTKNILSNPKVSLMICQSENQNTNPQSLARISLIGNATVLKRNDENYTSVKQNYLAKNPSAEMLFNLGDFQIFKIEITEGRFVAGFAKTFNLSKKNLEFLEI
jgi:heme iron utilization protein